MSLFLGACLIVLPWTLLVCIIVCMIVWGGVEMTALLILAAACFAAGLLVANG